MVCNVAAWEPREEGDAMSTRKPVLPTIPFASCEAWLEGYRATLGRTLAQARQEGLWHLGRLFGRGHRRRPGSRRTKGNRGKVRKLIDEGRMKPASLREVERASTDGRWEQ